jgi:N-carbamoyl-L-amino-acid hydrolase
VLADLAELAKIGLDPARGVTRTAFSSAFAEAVEWLLDVMARAGLSARCDAAGNVVGRVGPAGAPAVVIGSHIDTVPNGGRYDGALGVLAGIECARVLAPLVARGSLALEVIAFADEEGTFVSLFGSRSMTGRLDPAVLVGTKGERLAAVMADCGLELELVSRAHRTASEFATYLELHIEQGPLLEAAGIPIGVVTAITGCDTTRYHLQGAARHAGTTSMPARRDAGRAACQAVCDAYAAFESLDAPDTSRMTFGDIRLRPGASNVIPGVADVVSEVRSPDPYTLERLRTVTTAAFETAASAARVELAMYDHEVERPEALSPAMVGIIEQAARDADLPSMRLPSGAVHDAQMFAPVVPTGMIFVPSQNGISHHPDEYTAPDQIAAGTVVLLRAAATALKAPVA